MKGAEPAAVNNESAVLKQTEIESEIEKLQNENKTLKQRVNTLEMRINQMEQTESSNKRSLLHRIERLEAVQKRIDEQLRRNQQKHLPKLSPSPQSHFPLDQSDGHFLNGDNFGDDTTGFSGDDGLFNAAHGIEDDGLLDDDPDLRC